jgi:hypothetical protein
MILENSDQKPLRKARETKECHSQSIAFLTSKETALFEKKKNKMSYLSEESRSICHP